MINEGNMTGGLRKIWTDIQLDDENANAAAAACQQQLTESIILVVRGVAEWEGFSSELFLRQILGCIAFIYKSVCSRTITDRL